MQPTSSISDTGPAAFGVIAERFRRAGQAEKAVTLCREGLEKFPDHLSARVTLGWSLLDMGEHQEAFDQLKAVLKRAPDNLAAIRGLAELHERGIGLVFESLSDSEPETEFDPEMRTAEPAAGFDPEMPVAEAEPEFDPVMAATEPEPEFDPVMAATDAPVEMDLDPMLPALDGDLDPLVEPESPMYGALPAGVSTFEIEDVIEASEPDSMFDLSGLLDPPPVSEPVVARQPISLFGGKPLALRDEIANEQGGELTEWLSRVRQRRSDSVSQLMAG